MELITLVLGPNVNVNDVSPSSAWLNVFQTAVQTTTELGALISARELQNISSVTTSGASSLSQVQAVLDHYNQVCVCVCVCCVCVCVCVCVCLLCVVQV